MYIDIETESNHYIWYSYIALSDLVIINVIEVVNSSKKQSVVNQNLLNLCKKAEGTEGKKKSAWCNEAYIHPT